MGLRECAARAMEGQETFRPLERYGWDQTKDGRVKVGAFWERGETHVHTTKNDTINTYATTYKGILNEP